VKIQVDETSTLLKALKSAGQAIDLQGLRINNVKYNLSRGDQETNVYYYRGVQIICEMRGAIILF
jgi:hypothetical protein